jgi:hypothetical protein
MRAPALRPGRATKQSLHSRKYVLIDSEIASLRSQ